MLTGSSIPRRRAHGLTQVGGWGGGPPVSVAAIADDESAINLESSLQSCTAHRERILQMLTEEPDNQNLMDLRDQLTNAINQLQGTKSMVQRAQCSRQVGIASVPHGTILPGMGMDGTQSKAHSSRKNKPQRCSICGGIGHKSRTCTMAMQQQTQQNQAHVQWTGATPACISGQMGDGAQQMFVPVPMAAPPGSYVITTQNGQQQLVQPPASGVMTPQGGVMMPSMPMGAMGAQPLMVGSNMCKAVQAAESTASFQEQMPSGDPTVMFSEKVVCSKGDEENLRASGDGKEAEDRGEEQVREQHD